jgi:hypothetical protein
MTTQQESSSENDCVAGCLTYTGNETLHHRNCPLYPESLSKMLDDARLALGELDGTTDAAIKHLQSQNASLLERVAAAEKENKKLNELLNFNEEMRGEMVIEWNRCQQEIAELKAWQEKVCSIIQPAQTTEEWGMDVADIIASRIASARRQAMEFAEVVYYLESKHVDLTNNWRVLKMNLLTNMPSEFVMDAVDYLLFVGRLEKHTENEWYRLIKSATQAAPAEEVKG